jgi:hypothetical protein
MILELIEYNQKFSFSIFAVYDKICDILCNKI